MSTTSSGSLSHAHTESTGMKIHQNNSDSQRGTGSKKIVALGNLSGSSRSRYSNMGPPALIPRGPNVQTPFRINLHRGGGSLLDSFLAKVKEKGLGEGYQPVHSHYELLRQTMQKLAYSQGRTDTFTLEAQLRYIKGRKTTPELAGPSGCMETLGSIPTSVGVGDLKLAALTVIYPAFKKWSHDYGISLDDVKLRSQKWVEFVPKDPDIDAVRDQCYTFTGKQPKLKSNAHITVYLSITEELYNKIDEHISTHELQAAESSDGNTEAQKSGRCPQPKRQRLNETKSQESNAYTDDDLDDVSDEENQIELEPVRKVVHKVTDNQLRPLVPKPRLSTKNTSGLTPSHPTPLSENQVNATQPSHLERPLQSQNQAESGEYDPRWLLALSGVKKIGRSTVSELLVYHADLSLEDLLDNPDILGDDPRSSNAFSSTPTTFEFPVDPQIHYGAFKLAFKARSSEPLFNSGTRIVCMKQVYYISPSTGVKKPCDPAKQVHDLLAELTCLIWAKGLLELTYKSIRKMKEYFPGVPAMRFAKAGLALSQDPNKGTTVYLVEEYISSAEGKFRKYINNASAVPLVDTLPDEYHQQALFLSFAQHMQYLKTDGLAYVSDLQGSLSTLTDPQIITAMKTNFAKGNINHGKFEEQHLCNDFCKWFGLKPFTAQLKKDKQPDDYYVVSSGENHAPGSPPTPSQSAPTIPAATDANKTNQGKARGRPRGRGRGRGITTMGAASSDRVLRSKVVTMGKSLAPSDMEISVDAGPA
ncbi:hypothetical protein D9619_012350 [Psilocybe cf. subviscida]|uniref:Alpha-type protein kinase domain-containing protein n=1 Tax=Psilocybe cf. subviscida TaxID=2480587 RepID=A0A8H5AQV3_9AGAR|nr:hypothetical protein D9619_012350 [Psilocybe cf. subviscida]